MRRTKLVALAACAVLAACDNTDPVSPQEVTVIVNAEPPTVAVGEASTITVTAFLPDGSPAAGAPVQMETTLGTLARSQFLLDRSGLGSTVLESGAEPGTATVSAIVTVGALEAVGSIDVEILVPEPPEAAIEVSPTALDQQLSRSADACPNPFEPPLAVSQVASGELDYRVVEDLPAWLADTTVRTDASLAVASTTTTRAALSPPSTSATTPLIRGASGLEPRRLVTEPRTGRIPSGCRPATCRPPDRARSGIPTDRRGTNLALERSSNGDTRSRDRL